jgi:hypothetical protein
MGPAKKSNWNVDGICVYDPDVQSLFGDMTAMTIEYPDGTRFTMGSVSFSNPREEQLPVGWWNRFKERWIPRWLRWLPFLRVRYEAVWAIDCTGVPLAGE